MTIFEKLLTRARFLKSAPNMDQLPPDQGGEVAFAGRSNAGKSSVINILVNQNKLAKTSSVPGKTRSINLFILDDQRRLADLPGYGYAQVHPGEQKRWGRELTRYITERNCLKGIFVIVDIRRGLTEMDKQMLALAGEKPVYVVLNKADKLKNSPKKRAVQDISSTLREIHPQAACSAFSSLNLEGLKELRRILALWLG